MRRKPQSIYKQIREEIVGRVTSRCHVTAMFELIAKSYAHGWFQRLFSLKSCVEAVHHSNFSPHSEPHRHHHHHHHHHHDDRHHHHHHHHDDRRHHRHRHRNSHRRRHRNLDVILALTNDQLFLILNRLRHSCTSDQFCSCRYYLRPVLQIHPITCPQGTGILGRLSHNGDQNMLCHRGRTLSMQSSLQFSATLEFGVSTPFRKWWKVGKLENWKCHSWPTSGTGNDVCKFQVDTVSRFGGVHGTDRHKHAFSVL